MAEDERGIGTYPVGLLADIKHGRTLYGLRRVVRLVRARKWRSARNSLNGYLAEWHYAPDGVVTYRCGRGWTRAAARRSLGRKIVESNLSDREATR